MNVYDYSEADEVAANIKARVTTFSEAVAEISRVMGPPSEVGYQLHDNLAEALLFRCQTEQV